MKQTLKTIFFAFCLIAIGSCEDDVNPKVAANGFALRSAGGESTVVLTPQTDDQTVTTLDWDRSNNGGVNTVSAYQIEVAESGTAFANAVSANAGNNVTATDRTYVLTVGELNQLVNQLPGYQCGQEIAVDVRVKSILGQGFYNAFVQYSSNVITLHVVPYSSALPLLAFSSNATITADTPKMASSGVLNTDYEGYMYLTPGSYKFYKADACGGFSTPVVYGDDDSGSFDTLVLNGSGYDVLTAGFYLVRANLTQTGTMNYSIRPTTWNLFGAAKPNFPAANSALTYNQTTKVWETNITLSKGYEFKFRSNLNTFILGSFVAGSVNTANYGGPNLSYNGGDLNVPGTKSQPRVNASYHVTLDLNSPRNYSYTITENP